MVLKLWVACFLSNHLVLTHCYYGKTICDVPQEKGATYLREFPQTFSQFPASIPTKFPQFPANSHK